VNKAALAATAIFIDWTRRHQHEDCPCVKMEVIQDPETGHYRALPDTEKRCTGYKKVVLEPSYDWQWCNVSPAGAPKVGKHIKVQKYRVRVSCSRCKAAELSKWFKEDYVGYYDDEEIPF